MVGMIKDDRRVIRKGDKLVFKLEQIQEYEPEVRVKLLEGWNKELKEKTEWLSKYDEHLEIAKKDVETQLGFAKKKIEKDIEDLKKGIQIWDNVIEENYEEATPLKM